MLGPLTLPPRLARQALEDLHTLAVGIGRLTEREGDLSELLESVRTLPRVEDELSANVESLKAEVRALREWLEPMHRELTDLDDTAEKLETALAGFHEEIQDLRRKIPGI